jgi:hypothetical protein
LKHSEWLEVGAKVGELWPSQNWPPETMASAYDLFAMVAQSPAMQAVRELSSEGRDFAPAPGVVLSKALQIVIASTPMLPNPDLTRPLTEEELARSRRMAAALNGTKARLVQATWLEFGRHAKACAPCGLVADRCRRPGVGSRMADPWIEDCCRDGRPIYTAWREAVFELAGAAAVQQEARV